VILLNTTDPKSEESAALAEAIAEKYNVTTLPVDAMHMDGDEIAKVMEGLLYEFPVRQADVYMPSWCDGLPNDHWLKESVFRKLAEAAAGMKRVRDVGVVTEVMAQHENVSSCATDAVSLADGTVELHLDIPRETFYKIIHEETGFEVSGDGALLPLLRSLSQTDAAYKKVRAALQEVEQKGYGIVVPDLTELRLEKPELMRHGGQFGVKLQASAPSIHMMKATIETTVSPIVGSEKQSEDLVNYLLKEFEGDELRIWESNIFGKSLHELVNEGLAAKLNHMPEAARGKMRETLERIINEGSNGLICIIL
jgi:stage IV sporulation protein A